MVLTGARPREVNEGSAQPRRQPAASPRRRRLMAAACAILIAAIITGSAAAVYAERVTILSGLDSIHHANVGWVMGGLAAECASMAAFGLLQRQLLRAGGDNARVWRTPVHRLYEQCHKRGRPGGWLRHGGGLLATAVPGPRCGCRQGQPGPAGRGRRLDRGVRHHRGYRRHGVWRPGGEHGRPADQPGRGGGGGLPGGRPALTPRQGAPAAGRQARGPVGPAPSARPGGRRPGYRRRVLERLGSFNLGLPATAAALTWALVNWAADAACLAAVIAAIGVAVP
jgi:hypothetical protein